MFEKLKNLDMKTALRYAGIGFLAILALIVVFGIIATLFSLSRSVRESTSTSMSSDSASFGLPNDKGYAPPSESNSMRKDEVNLQSSEYGFRNAASTPVQSRDYDVKTYSVTIDSDEVKKDCQNILASLGATSIKKESVSIGERSCTFSIKVRKGNEQDFISFLKTFDIKDMNNNISNIIKTYTSLTQKIEETKKRLAEVEVLLETSKSSYDELWNSMKNAPLKPESIDALNRIILNKSELISKFSQQRAELKDTITMYEKQKAEGDEDIGYVGFSIFVRENVLIDFSSMKSVWRSDMRSFLLTMNETIRDITINLLSFILKTISVAIYVVIVLFAIVFSVKLAWRFGKWIWKGAEKK